jgi:hypothetical protein
MGLNERRKVEELKTTTLPARSKEIAEICGKSVPYEIDWDSFDTLDSLNFLDNISCHRLNMALRIICQDEMGKQAVKDGLKLVKLKNSKDKTVKLTFENGTLEMTNDYANKEYSSDNAIRALLIEKL